MALFQAFVAAEVILGVSTEQMSVAAGAALVVQQCDKRPTGQQLIPGGLCQGAKRRTSKLIW